MSKKLDFSFFYSLFQRKSKIYAIELDDLKINKAMFNLIGEVEDNIKELSRVIRQDNIGSKDAKLSELENNFMRLKGKVDSLREDVERIISLEIQNKDYITIHDDGYLADKAGRLESMSLELDELIDLIMTRPSMSDLKAHLLNDIYARVNNIIAFVNNVINDDKHLQESYSKLEIL